MTSAQVFLKNCLTPTRGRSFTHSHAYPKRVFPNRQAQAKYKDIIMPVIPDPKSLVPGNNNDSSKSQDESKKASAMDYISKGPQIPDEMPPKASREEIEARKKELNKSD
ncbi:hypothetical protein BJX61DRAFT_514763 [Aspergillus egyptiacus]|nr:hypothetical protein BJX61DRAFT_514763 [Aspergillus egyptiacus]